MSDNENGKVLQLRQYGGRSWEDSRGKLYRAIMAGRDFKTGAMHGESDDGYGFGSGTGRLPEDWRQVFKEDSPDYVVYSYATPIAWHVPDDGDDGGARWVIPDVKYSPTTTRHQNLVRTALVFDREPYRETVEEAR